MNPFEVIAEAVCPDRSDSATAHSVCRTSAEKALAALSAAGFTVAQTETIQNEQDYASSLRRDLNQLAAHLRELCDYADKHPDKDGNTWVHADHILRLLSSEPPVELERGADAPSPVATFEPGWLPEQIAKSKATLDSLPPDLRASLGKPGPERGIDQGGANG